MSYTVTISKTEEIIDDVPNEKWLKVRDEEVDGLKIYEYVQPPPEKKTVVTDVYEQTVDDLSVKAVIEAVNHTT